jgi:hypothetical protein
MTLYSDGDTEFENPTLDAAIERTDYQLHYSRSPVRRAFHNDGISGSQIDDAFHPGETMSGEWCAGMNWIHDWDVPEAVWIERFFTVAIQEAVHEALEWFRLDGQVLLSPHDADHEVDILDRSAEFAETLFSLISRDKLERPQ